MDPKLTRVIRSEVNLGSQNRFPGGGGLFSHLSCSTYQHQPGVTRAQCCESIGWHL